MEISLFDKIAPIVALFVFVLPLLSFGLFPNFTRTVLRALFDVGEEVSRDEIDHTMNVLSNRAKYNSRNMSIDELFQEKVEKPIKTGEIKEMELDPNITTPYYFEKKYAGTKINPEEQKSKLEKVLS